MRILFLGNGWLGWQVLDWLVSEGEEVVGIVLHMPGNRKFGSEMLRIAENARIPVLDDSIINSPKAYRAIIAQSSDIGLSILFGRVIPKPFIDMFPKGIINLHPAYLPYNRGSYTNVWPIFDGTPAGVTLHYIDTEIDTGDIVAQHRIPILPTDTGESLYHRLERSALSLFKTKWPSIRTGTSSRTPQQGPSTNHRVREVDQYDLIELDKTYTARYLIDILRARTFPPHKGAYFEIDGERIYIRLQLLPEAEL